MSDPDLWITIEPPAHPLVLGPGGAALGLRGYVHGGAPFALSGLRLVQGGLHAEARHRHVETGMLGAFTLAERARPGDRVAGGFYLSAHVPDAGFSDGPAAVEADLVQGDGRVVPTRLCGVAILRADPLDDGHAPAGEGGARVGIALACHEPEPALFARQVASLRAQTHADWICVVADDGSSPAALAGVRRVLGDDPRFRLVADGRRLGFTRNFERACARLPLSCTHVAFCDQDDAWRPERLARGLAALGDRGFACAYADMELVDAAGARLSETFWVHRRPAYGSLAGLLLANVATGMTMLATRPVLAEALPFPAAPGLTYHDHWLALVAARRGALTYVPEALVAYVQHGGNHTGALGLPVPSRAVLAQALGRFPRAVRVALAEGAPRHALTLPGVLDWAEREPARLRILAARLAAAGPPEPGDRGLLALVRAPGPLRLALSGAAWGERHRRAQAIELGLGLWLGRLHRALLRLGPARGANRGR